MKSTDIHKSEWMPLYDAIPFKSKRVAFEAMGFEFSHHLLKKQYITIEQFEKLKEMNSNLVLGSNNSVGEPVDYDHNQMMHYNNSLVSLITSDTFKTYKQHNKSKVLDEQLRIQKLINKNK